MSDEAAKRYRLWWCRLAMMLSVALGSVLSHGTAQAMTGLDLLGYCNSVDSAGRTHCKGYIGGVFDSVVLFSLQANVSAQLICPPLEGVKMRQLNRVVIKYLEDNPGKLHEESIFLVIDAFATAFPCQGSRR